MAQSLSQLRSFCAVRLTRVASHSCRRALAEELAEGANGPAADFLTAASDAGPPGVADSNALDIDGATEEAPGQLRHSAGGPGPDGSWPQGGHAGHHRPCNGSPPDARSLFELVLCRHHCVPDPTWREREGGREWDTIKPLGVHGEEGKGRRRQPERCGSTDSPSRPRPSPGQPRLTYACPDMCLPCRPAAGPCAAAGQREPQGRAGCGRSGLGGGCAPEAYGPGLPAAPHPMLHCSIVTATGLPSHKPLQPGGRSLRLAVTPSRARLDVHALPAPARRGEQPARGAHVGARGRRRAGGVEDAAGRAAGAAGTREGPHPHSQEGPCPMPCVSRTGPCTVRHQHLV